MWLVSAVVISTLRVLHDQKIITSAVKSVCGLFEAEILN